MLELFSALGIQKLIKHELLSLTELTFQEETIIIKSICIIYSELDSDKC